MAKFGSCIVAMLFVVDTTDAQAPQRSPAADRHPITAPVKYAGVYHLGTGQWTRTSGAPHAMLGSSDMVVYNNTCQTGYFFHLPLGASSTDSGEIPSTSAPLWGSLLPGGFDAHPGCANSYSITGFQIGYCTDQTSVDINVGFQDRWMYCDPPATVQGFALTSMPGSAIAGVQACWTLDIDLSATSSTFSILADGNGAYDGINLGFNENLFGWTISFAGPGGSAFGTGPILAGDRYMCSETDGTRWDLQASSPPPIWPANRTSGPGGGPESGTGMGYDYSVRIDGGGYSGCYAMGNGLGYHLMLFATDACPSPAPASFCPGDGTGQPCPCGNSGASGSGCANSVNSAGAQVLASGSLSPDTLVLTASGEPLTASSVLLQGTVDMFVPFGDGVCCVSGTLKRLFVRSASAGSVSFPPPSGPSISAQSALLGDPILPGTMRTYQVYYRDANLGFCPPPQGNSWNVTNGLHVPW